MQPGRASLTARQVARTRSTAPRVAASFGDPDAEQRLCEDLGAVALRPRGTLHRYLLARTRFYDEQLVAALDSGTTQVVLAGAGYDGRALRYAKPGVRFFEVDHPDTQRDKRERLSRLDLERDHITFVTADFTTDDVTTALADAGHARDVTTFFMCEGVTPYLERPVVAGLLGALARTASPDSRFALDLRIRRGDEPWWDKARQAALDTALTAMGEPPKGGYAPEEVEPLLADAGWRLVEARGPASPGDDGAGHLRFVVAAPTP